MLPPKDPPHAKFSKYFDDAYRKVYGRGYLWGRKSNEQPSIEVDHRRHSDSTYRDRLRVVDTYFADRSGF